MGSKASKQIELNNYFTWMGDDGIVRTRVKPRATVVLEDAIENCICVNDLSENRFSLIVDARGVKSISKEAREHFAVKGRSTKCMSIAIIVDSHLSRIIANFYMALSKPALPVKIFNSEEGAIEWFKFEEH